MRDKIIALVLLLLTAGAASTFAAAKQGELRRALAFWLGWLVPGLGHVMLGRVRKALFFFGVIAALYLAGLWICGWRTVSFDDNPFYYVGQFGSGVTLVLGHALGIEKAYPRPDLPMAWYDPGLLYVCVAGLLNLVVMLNTLEKKKADATAPEAAEGKPAPAPEVKG